MTVPISVSSTDFELIFEFRSSILVLCWGTVIKCLTDFVDGRTNSSTRQQLTFRADNFIALQNG